MDGAVIAAVVIGAVFLLGMVAAAGYAARMLPSGARVPLNAGVPEYSVWLPKPAGLAAWLGVGVAAFAAVGALTLSGLAANWEQSTRFVLLPGVMLVVLAGEASAIIVAKRAIALTFHRHDGGSWRIELRCDKLATWPLAERLDLRSVPWPARAP